MASLRSRFVSLLRWSERFTKTDMVYLTTNGFWVTASTIVASLGSFLIYTVFGHIVSPSVYGTYQYLISAGAIIGAFTLTGMNVAVTRAVAQGKEGSLKYAMRSQFIWGILPLFISFGVAAYYFLKGNIEFSTGFVLIGIFVPFNNALNTYVSYLNAKQDFKRTFIYGLFVNIPYYLAVIGVSIFIPIALILLVANLVAQALGLLFSYYRTIKTYPPNDVPDEGMVRYGLHLSFMNLIGYVVAQLDSIFAFHFVGAAGLAIYGFATAIPDRLSVFKSLSVIAFPKFANKSHEELRDSFGKRLWLSIGTTAVIAVVYYFFAPILFKIFFPLYTEAVPFSRLYALLIIGSIAPLFTSALTAEGRVKELYWYNIVTPLVLVTLEIGGVIWWGLWGLIIARVIHGFFASLYSWILFIRRPRNQLVNQVV